jgi:hypothetical protein
VEEEKIVPNYALDLINAQHTTEKKRLWIALIIVFIALVSTNFFWIHREFQYEDVVLTQTVSADEANNVALNGVGTGELSYYGDKGITDIESKTQESGR